MLRLSPTSPSPSEALLQVGEAEAAAKAAFHMRLRARGLRDLSVLRAFERVSRADFVAPAYAALAARDLPVPLPCGQTSHEPWLSARAVEALDVTPHARVLEIGSGSGYVTAVLAQLAGEVMGIERFGGLVDEAQAKLFALGAAHAGIVWGDGLNLPPDIGAFDRILIHGYLPDIPSSIGNRLAPGGRIVAGGPALGGQTLTLWAEGQAPAPLGPCRFAPLIPGLAAAL